MERERQSRFDLFVLFGLILWGVFTLFEGSPLIAAVVGALLLVFALKDPMVGKDQQKEELPSASGANLEPPKPAFLFSKTLEMRDGL